MALLERVSTLLRANLNDLIEKAEDPERMLKQIVLDMENQGWNLNALQYLANITMSQEVVVESSGLLGRC